MDESLDSQRRDSDLLLNHSRSLLESEKQILRSAFGESTSENARPRIRPDHDFVLYMERLDREREKGRRWSEMIGQIVLGAGMLLLLFFVLSYWHAGIENMRNHVHVFEALGAWVDTLPIFFQAIIVLLFVAISVIVFIYGVAVFLAVPIILVLFNTADILHRLITDKKRSLFA